MSRRSLPRLPNDRPPLTDEEGEVRELTEEDFKHFRPMKDVFPEIVEVFERARGQRGPQKAPVKERVGLRLDQEVVEHFRSTGPGWQSRINEVLVKHVRGGRG
ncbi:MAG: BrnA antitoxin family protein [Mesorhizobium sp.]|nr:BrnA antitoxin family protein [Mesorhizobium sp.]